MREDRFVDEGEDLEAISPCSNCEYKFDEEPGCKAFPIKIPMEILLGENQHTEPLPDQGNELVFKEI